MTEELLKRNRKRRIKKKYLIPLLFIATVLIVTYAFPRQGKFKYSFSVGRPWQYGLQTATFDFPIYKPNAVLKAEQDSLLLYFEPYYNLEKEVKETQLAIFDLDTKESKKLKNLPPGYISYIRSKLEEVFDAGVISSEDHEKISNSETLSFMLKSGNKANSTNINEVYTARLAYDFIIANLPRNQHVDIVKSADINKYISQNIEYDEEWTEKAKTEFLQRVSPAVGIVQAGQRIIDQGEIVDSVTYNILSSLKRVTEERSGETSNGVWILLGQLLLTTILLFSLHFYLLYFRATEYCNLTHVLFILELILLFVIITAIIVKLNLPYIYVIPYAIITILIRTFIDSRTAMYTSVITILLCSLMVPFRFEFIVTQILVTSVAILFLNELSERSQLIRCSFFILVAYFIIYFGLEIYQDGNISKIEYSTFISFIINFIFVMFSYSLIYMIEKVFGFTSDVTLVELSNVNKPLLKELSEKAPGTFQHSLQVSNLASAAAMKLGANASLIRTGALYHDIGKLNNPAFFTENQAPGMNPHDGLPYEESARIIINHVKDGVQTARKYNLPKQIIDFIETHHGTSMPKYFYISWMNANPGKEVNEADFRYPGPNPFSKETAILMMADTVEAASRSLKEYTEDSIKSLVNKLIDSQMEEGLLLNSPLTFKDIETAKSVFIDKLLTIYHSRIQYPDNDK